MRPPDAQPGPEPGADEAPTAHARPGTAGGAIPSSGPGAFRALRRYALPRDDGASPRCELCAARTDAKHAHLVDRTKRSLACVCHPCAILFGDPGAGAGRWRRVPDRVAHDDAFSFPEPAWTALHLPVRLAFFLRPPPGDRWMAFLPGPAGVTEAELPEAAWAEVARQPLVAAAEAEVEALLAWLPRGAATSSAFLVPASSCYELAGLLRRHHRGFDGGEEARRALDDFFAALRARSRPLSSGGRR